MDSPLVSTSWLAQHLEQPNLILLNVSMAPVVGKNHQYEKPVYIPHTYLLDIEKDWFDANSSQLHAMPGVAQFKKLVTQLGITKRDCIVLYDHQGVYSSPRIWWTFRTMGWRNVYVLDGGLPQWMAQKQPTVSEPEQPVSTATSQQEVTPDLQLCCDSSGVLHFLDHLEYVVVDARSPGRFSGKEPEPREGIRSGHIPSAKNIPYVELFDGYCFKSTSQLRSIFEEQHIQSHHKLIASCGSGITACIVLLAATIAGYSNCILYDGSWTDWGSNFQLPVEL
ncbi:MAG: 3-mercaptopyruvate sulfurtransferase [Candidatus Celerinatantimonas neptuna]|nr:MAG: 3-mercaptopyruvate sulfurtransferase [Candidatus Celerinatantimonas neptuna]